MPPLGLLGVEEPKLVETLARLGTNIRDRHGGVDVTRAIDVAVYEKP